MSTRREFLTTGSALAAGAALFSGMPAMAQGMSGGGQVSTHTLPELPYAYDALEPYIDARTSTRISATSRRSGHTFRPRPPALRAAAGPCCTIVPKMTA